MSIRISVALSSLAMLPAIGWSESAAAQNDVVENDGATAILVTSRKPGDTVLTFGVPLEEAPFRSPPAGDC